jgi:hypothetical protein
MAVQPRVVFRRFAPHDAAYLEPWMTHLSRVLGTRAPVPERTADMTVWQLISANNRELARSARIYSGFAAARASAQATILGLPDAMVNLAVDERRGLQGWFVTIDGEPEMVCSRWYFADRERGQAVTLAISALTNAVLAEGTRVSQDRTLQAGDIRVR